MKRRATTELLKDLDALRKHQVQTQASLDRVVEHITRLERGSRIFSLLDELDKDAESNIIYIVDWADVEHSHDPNYMLDFGLPYGKAFQQLAGEWEACEGELSHIGVNVGGKGQLEVEGVKLICKVDWIPEPSATPDEDVHKNCGTFFKQVGFIGHQSTLNTFALAIERIMRETFE